MKIIARIFGVCIMLIMTSMIFMESMGLTIRQDELNNCISSAVTTTQIVMKENIEDKVYGTENARYTITSNDDYLSLFKTCLEKSRTSNTKFNIKVYGVDYTKGYIDVGVEAVFPMINGTMRTISSRQTNLIEVYEGEVDPVYGNAPDNFSYTENIGYTGYSQMWTAPKSGKYKIEVWGASSGRKMQDDVYVEDTISYGGYSVGYLYLENGQELYISVGGQGKDGIIGQANGGWNGGGSGEWDHNIEVGNEATAGGGGATSVTTSLIGDGQLKNYEYSKTTDVVIVAGGGGSQARIDKISSSSGGGISGNKGEITPSSLVTSTAEGGTQNSGYKFGEGESAVKNSKLYINSEIGAGGGGWYGGCSPQDIGDYLYAGGGGGSGYIGYSKLISNGDANPKHMAGYNVTTSNDAQTKTISVTEVSKNPETDKAKLGNGAARITYINENETGSPGYNPLMTLVSDNDNNHYVSVGDIVETTSQFYASGVTGVPTKYLVINTSDNFAEVMALTPYSTVAMNVTNKVKYSDGSENWEYDGTAIDQSLNVSFYNKLSGNTKSAIRSRTIYQSCYQIATSGGTNPPTGTDPANNDYVLLKKSSHLVGEHAVDQKLEQAIVGNKKYIYLPDVDNILGTLGMSWSAADVDQFFAGDTSNIWTRSVTPEGNAIVIDSAGKKINYAAVNSATGAVRPVMQIDKTAIIIDEYTWGGSYTAAAPYKAELEAAGLQEVEYVGSTGWQYINTGVKTNTKTWVDMDFTFDKNTSSYLFMFGHWNTLSVGINSGELCAAGGGNDFNNTAGFDLNYSVSIGARSRAIFGQGNIIYNGDVVQSVTSDNRVSTDNNLMVFGNSALTSVNNPHTWDGTNGYGCGRVYALTIYEGKFNDSSSSTVLRKYIPVKAQDGSSAGLYDLAHNQYYPIQGTGYTVGPVK